LQVPVEAVVRNGGETFCYVKSGKELQERKVTTGARNDLNVEIKEGLKEDEQVLRSPGAVAAVGQPRVPGETGAGLTLVRSLRIEPDARRRSFVESYGLTDTDLQRILALPDVTALAAVRSFPAEIRRRERSLLGRVVATGPEYLDLTGVRPAAGRFLQDEDGFATRNVAVLGADVAERLFPDQEPLGRTVRVHRADFVVVGVLEEQDRPAGGLTAEEANRGVWLPLETAAKQLGERVIVRRGGSRSVEAVRLSEILVQSRRSSETGFTAASISDLLEAAHPRKDWEVQVIGSGD
jgi:putative ABC transport system permease protein